MKLKVPKYTNYPPIDNNQPKIKKKIKTTNGDAVTVAKREDKLTKKTTEKTVKKTHKNHHR
jgi:hypothetical protein